MRIELPIAEGFYQSQDKKLANKRLINYFKVIPETKALSQAALFGTPGITELSDETLGVSRGVIRFSDGVPYRVIGNSLYSYNSAFVATNRGTVNGATDVTMASNGINIAIVAPDGDSYFYTPSTDTFEKIVSAGFLSFGRVESVAFKDGFYVFSTSTQIFSSSPVTVNDGKDFNSIDFATPEVTPDKVNRVFVNHNILYALGEFTIESYQTIATTGFPFQRINDRLIQKGLTSRDAVTRLNNHWVFLGADENESPAVWRVIGSSIQKISTSSIDTLIAAAGLTNQTSSSMWSYSQNGNYFAILRIGQHTFVYDETTSSLSGENTWHERQTGITRGDSFASWRAVHGVLAYGKMTVGDDRSAKTGELALDVFTEYGALIEAVVSTTPFTQKGEDIFSHEVELEMQSGFGNAACPDPQMRMDYSDDGSQTYSNPVSVSMGRQGQYQNRVRWSRLGSFNKSRGLRFITTDPVRRDIYALYANAEATSSGSQ